MSIRRASNAARQVAQPKQTAKPKSQPSTKPSTAVTRPFTPATGSVGGKVGASKPAPAKELGKALGTVAKAKKEKTVAGKVLTPYRGVVSGIGHVFRKALIAGEKWVDRKKG